MGTVTIFNNTSDKIYVRVTADGESGGNESFALIESGDSEYWSRSDYQVVFVLRNDTGATEVFTVIPGNNYTVG
ncbi:hypothetical protein SCLCIDRAFT_115773 [Scleroderma citrinum Foug A]|uniref:Uncharacterized protein n=1 Tax=Scleroderma citrinum Foug A TaxID=1036808 RepID=A0A0C3AGV8_9AGAM|nr:hypothetical protein SCLCIDRAFT_115773 [Scleroderma citrinum Foug A]